VSQNPVSSVSLLQENNEQMRVLNFDEQRRYLDSASPVLRDVARIILETGMRPEEVYTLRKGNISVSGGFVAIPFGKTKAARRKLFLNDCVKAIVAQRIEASESEYLFPCDTDSTRPIPKVNNAHDAALRKSGVAKFRLYDLRHTWATRAAMAGVDLV